MKDTIWRGITWRDVPGKKPDNQRLSFALLKRGAHPFYRTAGRKPNIAATLEGSALAARLEEIAAQNRINGAKKQLP